MKAEIRQSPASFSVEVYLYVRTDSETIICNLDGSEKQRIPAGSAETAEPSFVADDQTIRALIEAGSDFLPPSQATDRHLADAIKVRDRLLDAYLPQRERGAA
jgi:hypothetical protein